MGFGSFVSSITGGDLISAGASILGGVMGSNSASQSQANQIAWERERAKNAIQWQVEDMRKAGINPLLAAQYGGAQTGGVGSSSYDWANSFNNAAKNVADRHRIEIERKTADADIQYKNTSSQVNIANAQTLTKQGEFYDAQKKYYENLSQGALINNYLNTLSIPGAINNANFNSSWVGKSMPYVNAISNTAKDLGQAYGSIKFPGIYERSHDYRPPRIYEKTHYNRHGEVTGGTNYRYE